MANDPALDELRSFMSRYARAKAVVDQRSAEVEKALAAKIDPATGKLERGALARITEISGMSRTHVERLRDGKTSGSGHDATPSGS